MTSPRVTLLLLVALSMAISINGVPAGYTEIFSASAEADFIAGNFARNGVVDTTFPASTCPGAIYGAAHVGQNDVITATFDSLPAHHAVVVELDLWFVDSWDNESAYLWIGNSGDSTVIGTELHSWTHNYETGSPTNACPDVSNFNDHSVAYESPVVVHTGSSVEVTIKNNLSDLADDESVGITNFSVWIAECIDNCDVCSDSTTCTTCGLGYSVENDVCVLDCDTSDVITRHEGVMWIHDLAPDAAATRGSGQTDIVFSFGEPATCPGSAMDFEAAFVEAGTEAGSDVYVDGTDWKVDLILTDTDLLNPTICAASSTLVSGTVVYSCTLWFSGFYLDDRVVNWSYVLTAQLQTDSTIDLSIITDTGSIAGDSVDLPIESAFVTSFTDSTPQVDSEFIVGDEIFIEVTAPTGLQGSLIGDITLVTISDNENTDVFDMTSLTVDQTNGNGHIIVRVPLILVTDSATISVTCEWSLASRVRRLEEAENTTTYNVTIDIKPLAEDSNESEDDSSSSSGSDNTMMIVIAAVSAIVLVAAIGFGYKYISKSKKQTQEAVAVPTNDVVNKV